MGTTYNTEGSLIMVSGMGSYMLWLIEQTSHSFVKVHKLKSKSHAYLDHRRVI